MKRSLVLLLAAVLGRAPVTAAPAAAPAPARACCCAAASATRGCAMPCGVARRPLPGAAVFASLPSQPSFPSPAAGIAAAFLPPAPFTPGAALSVDAPRAPPGAPLYLLHRTFLL